MADILFVYGTLRPGRQNGSGKGPTVRIPGLLYNLGWYPGIKLGDRFTGVPEGVSVVCEAVEVPNEAEWDRLNAYEGYNPADPMRSLYIRREVTCSNGTTGFIYEYNRRIDPENHPLIVSGDWLEHTNSKKGINGYERGF